MPASLPACLPASLLHSSLSPYLADSFSLASEINSFRILLVFRTHTALKFYRTGKAHTHTHTHIRSWGCACVTLGIGLSSEIFRSIHPAAKRRSLECKQPSTAILRPKVCLDNTALLVRTTPYNPILYFLYSIAPPPNPLCHVGTISLSKQMRNFSFWGPSRFIVVLLAAAASGQWVRPTPSPLPTAHRVTH